MVLTALKETDERLRQLCADITRPALRTREQQVEIDELLDYVYGAANKSVSGIQRDRTRPATVGLSANQVGIMKRISIVDLSIGRRGYHDIHVLVNPKVVWRSKSMLEKHEGCVNFPNIWGKTRRSKIVRVEAWDRSGHLLSLELDGWAAALLQHEVDHLNGRLFIDRLIDPSRADLVEADEYKNYVKSKNEWPRKIDVSRRILYEH